MQLAESVVESFHADSLKPPSHSKVSIPLYWHHDIIIVLIRSFVKFFCDCFLCSFFFFLN